MGIFGFSKSGPITDDDYDHLPEPPRDGNPNKYRFKVKRRLDFGKACVVEVNYPDCRNHKGNKILVYDDKKILDRGVKANCLDPHFLEIGNSPVARFEPTETGWIFAITFAKVLGGVSTYETVSNVESRV